MTNARQLGKLICNSLYGKRPLRPMRKWAWVSHCIFMHGFSKTIGTIPGTNTSICTHGFYYDA